MTRKARIFVQIASYRDPELVPTLDSLFVQAAEPQNLSVGICWQYKPGVDPEQPKTGYPDIRWISVPNTESKGVCWARAQVQSLYQEEAYTLQIDSHMRFVKDWDKKLIEDLASCGSKKAVISHHPPSYGPPDKLSSDAKLTILCATQPNSSGDIRLRGEPLDKNPPKPLQGAFAAPGFLFAAGRLVKEVPYDPHLYFDQEEMCLSSRLYTHGWDVYHPKRLYAYHLYDSTPVPYPRHKHWSDNPGWSDLNRIALERRDHLLGYQLAESDAALQDMDAYGQGEARSLEDFGTFCGIDFSTRVVTPKAIQGTFISDLAKYRKLAALPPTAQPQEKAAPAPAAHMQRPRIVSQWTGVPVESFTPRTLDILQDLPYGGDGPKPEIAPAPPGVLIIRNFASPALCKKLMDYADSAVRRKLEVVDHDKTTRDKVVTVASSGRITDQVTINGMPMEILTLFMDIHLKRMAPFFGVEFEWFERPQILRYSAGGRYDPHADADHWEPPTGQWLRSQDRDLSVLLYLNDTYEGGEIGFDKLGFEMKPEAGMLLAFPSDHRYLHAARPTHSGLRYTIVSWSATLGTPRVQAQAPYASIHLHTPT